MILVKATGRVLSLSQCGISVDKRFAFYDQIHTTGMDIKHTLSARAALTLGKDMVFRDLAQGAFRMRGIGEGQTVTILIIPEVKELMHRQLAKAGCAPVINVAAESALAAHGRVNGYVDSDAYHMKQRALRGVTAWLVINSMNSERVQFDQLCHQNIANIWRQNAHNQLIAGHASFRVNKGAASGFVLDALGEAFLSTREGSVSRAKLEGKVVAIYFCQAPGSSTELSRALCEVYEEKSHELEVVFVSSAGSAEEFSASFRAMPWLAIPFSHTQRRLRLRQLFELPEGASQVVLVSPDGHTITREGAMLLQLAHTCAAALRAKEKKSKEFTSEREQLEKEQKKLSEQILGLKPLEDNMQGYARRLAKLRPSELDEVAQFLVEPKPSPEAQASLEASEAIIDDIPSIDDETAASSSSGTQSASSSTLSTPKKRKS